MKITDFINSKSIAKYLDDIQYKFNAVEAAYIVWQSKLSMRKKYAAWEEIIATFSDMPLKKRRWGFEQDEPSFLAFLRRFIDARKSGDKIWDHEPFEGLWFQIPTPFKAGDIVYQGNESVYEGKEKKEPFVLLDIASWGEKELRENGCTDEKYIANCERLIKHHMEEGDDTDMLSAGYFIDDFGRMYREHTIFGTYLDLEYYDEELTGERRFLIALSNFVKKKIDIATLANAYKITMDETRLEYIKEHTGCAYLDEQKRLAGFTEDE